VRRTGPRGDGLRELLIACREYRLPGCPKPGPWAAPRGRRDELLEALKAGGPVEVGAADLMLGLMHAGMDYRSYAHTVGPIGTRCSGLTSTTG
jgi:hypothetical protein